MNICITGVTSGIGKSLTNILIKKGNVVWGIGRKKEILEEMKKKFPQARFLYSVCDVENIDDVKKIKKEMEKIDFFPEVIILGAAIYKDDIKPEFDNQMFRKILSTNLFGSTNFIEVFLPWFLIRKKGQFIALSSIAAYKPNYRGIGYASSKAALSMTFRGLNLAYNDKNIVFSNIYMGPVDTPMWQGKKSILVAKPDYVAEKICKVIITKDLQTFIPFLSTTMFKILRYLPDKYYAGLAEGYKKSIK